MILPAAPDAGVSTTRLTTLETGALQLLTERQSVENAATPCPSGIPADRRAAEGEWSPPIPWPVVAVHLNQLPDGRVLSWGRVGAPKVWDPATGTFGEAPSSSMVFCGGHAFLADGRLLVAGGHLADHRGIADANIYDGQAWLPIPPMERARWYPTTTTLANGEVLTTGGTDEEGSYVDLPEVWDGSGWRPLTGARRLLPYYPRTFVAPNGLVFYAGELQETAYLDPAGEGRWIPVGQSKYGRRDYGSAVMYLPGKVLIVGGSDPPDGAPTSTAEVIDLNQASPSWRYTAPLRHPRRHHNATILADGQVLVTGGTSAAGFSTLSGAVRSTELWDPITEQWNQLASNQVARVYHSTTILLPDGRVLHAGSGDGADLPRELTAELFSPPALFRGPRPVLESAPERVTYQESFFVQTTDAARVVRATLVRPSSVTHAFDQNQRFNELLVRRTAGGLTLTAPATNRVAPPGVYLLFLLDAAGVPSRASTIRLE